MISEAVRFVVTLALTWVGFIVGRAIPEWYEASRVDPDVSIVIGAVIGAGIGYVVGGLFGRVIDRVLDRAPDLVAHATGPQLFAGTFGMVAGVLVGVVGSVPLVLLTPAPVGWSVSALIVLVLGSFGARVFAARAGELIAAAGTRGRRRDGGRLGGYVLDTSAAIDGRILELSRVGLVAGTVWVSEFVIDELQGIADSGTKNRRRRGRRGLDVLDALREIDSIDLHISDESFPEHEEVDAKILALCRLTEATLVSTDHNLVKAAGLRGISVLNPHSLGELMRPTLVAGDLVTLLIEKEGSEPGQGVGYLEDGTMVVIEDGASVAGQTVEVEVANTLRTSMGRMVFARLKT